MLTTVEAVLQPEGTLQFLEPVHFDKPQHVLVTFTAYSDEALSGLALSEPVLANDWLRDEEEEAWAHLQPGR
jgi:hypothetical protein